MFNNFSASFPPIAVIGIFVISEISFDISSDEIYLVEFFIVVEVLSNISIALSGSTLFPIVFSERSIHAISAG